MTESQPTPPAPTPADGEYRKLNIDIALRSYKEYDRALLTLAGGALALSMTFLNDITTPEPAVWWTLMTAWALWIVSLLGVVASHLCSAKAMEAIIKNCDGRPDGRADGGRAGHAVRLLNYVTGPAFAVGIIFFGVFVTNNRSHHAGQVASAASSPTSAPAPAARPGHASTDSGRKGDSTNAQAGAAAQPSIGPRQ